MCRKSQTKENKYKIYYASWRIVVWFLILAVVAVGCISAFYGFVNKCCPPNFFENDNFLSGLLGVMLGFIFDLLIINRIREIFKYKSLVTTITKEVDSMLGGIFGDKYTDSKTLNNIVSEENGKWDFVYDEKFGEKKPKLNPKIKEEISNFATANPKKIFVNSLLKSILTSADFEAIFLKFNKGLHKNLHEINSFIDKFNDEYDLHKEDRSYYLNYLVQTLCEFYALTKLSINKKVKNKKVKI